ncbi:beta-phosphoglucomutase [Lachnoclostridium phytofermentans]|uniref:Beta-phosphoglucomutase n=1 Tax=Lachnoclostridium phytofermentans (strain ATCC 700394 / DSM 18823 / ISDg) TaxID=357809 RepID=A9KSL3_LACP7|nr:beta-phosphoglucomutase [Lachnoclostridium phytofermentans]ABX43665.1 beta-phosphoglucomutase [Lachnoclostridium phytofermentans ISDg]
MIKGVIFDLDGVLVSTDELHYEAWAKLARELNINNYTKEDNKAQKGISRMESLEIVLKKGNIAYTEKEKEALADRKNNYYVEMLDSLNDSAVLKDVKEALAMLKNRGIKIGVGSASKNTPLILEKTGLEPSIDAVSCGIDVTKSKPDPEVFLVAAKKLCLPPNECLVVEDSYAGVVAAKAAGMKSLAVGPERKLLEADYDSETLLSETDWDLMLKISYNF